MIAKIEIPGLDKHYEVSEFRPGIVDIRVVNRAGEIAECWYLYADKAEEFFKEAQKVAKAARK